MANWSFPYRIVMSYVFIHPIEQFTIVDSLDGFQMEIPSEAPRLLQQHNPDGGACQKSDVNNYKLQSHPSILWTVSKSSPATMPLLWFWFLLAGWGWAVKSWQHSVNTFWMRTWQKLFRANFLKIENYTEISITKKKKYTLHSHKKSTKSVCDRREQRVISHYSTILLWSGLLIYCGLLSHERKDSCKLVMTAKHLKASTLKKKW